MSSKGVAIALRLTNATLNIESPMGASMAIGAAVANAILLVTIAERHRMEGAHASAAAVEGATGRLRPILITSRWRRSLARAALNRRRWGET